MNKGYSLNGINIYHDGDVLRWMGIIEEASCPLIYDGDTIIAYNTIILLWNVFVTTNLGLRSEKLPDKFDIYVQGLPQWTQTKYFYDLRDIDRPDRFGECATGRILMPEDGIIHETLDKLKPIIDSLILQRDKDMYRWRCSAPIPTREEQQKRASKLELIIG